VGFGEGDVPEFFGSGIAVEDAFLASVHVHAVEPATIAGVSETDGELISVILGLSDAFGERFVPCFGFEDGKFGVAIDKNVIGRRWLAGAPKALEPTPSDRIFALNTAGFDDTPSRRF